MGPPPPDCWCPSILLPPKLLDESLRKIHSSAPWGLSLRCPASWANIFQAKAGEGGIWRHWFVTLGNRNHGINFFSEYNNLLLLLGSEILFLLFDSLRKFFNEWFTISKFESLLNINKWIYMYHICWQKLY